MAKTGITDAIRAALDAADDSQSVRQVFDQMVAQGFACTTNSIKQIMSERAVAGEFIRNEIGGQVSYTLNPEFASRRKSRAPGALSKAILAVVGGATAPLTNAEIHAALVRRGGGDVPAPNSLSALLANLWQKGAVQKERKGSISLWSLPISFPPAAGAGDDASPASVASEAAPHPPGAEQAPAAALSSTSEEDSIAEEAQQLHGDAEDCDAPPAPAGCPLATTAKAAPFTMFEPEPAPTSPSPPRLPFGLQERLDSIAQDISDALTDACTAKLPHELIGHLVTSSHAIHRAARATGA